MAKRAAAAIDSETGHCRGGGTHVRSTGEIGAVQVGKLESKGWQNRRVSVILID